MADTKKKSQAQKAAAGNKSSKSAPKKTAAKKPAANTKAAAKTKEPGFQIPVRLLTSVICIGLFILFLVMFFNPEGQLIVLLQNLILGFIGGVSFYVAIPGLLYLFVIQAFSGKRPILLRSICMIIFILLCGCISQLGLNTTLPEGLGVLAVLWNGGIDGTAAGVLCGGIALIFQWLCGTVISYVIFIIAAILTLLAAFQITLPSIIRAIQNRPRIDWDEDDFEEEQEPAAVVVNHIANKRIEQKRRIREEQQLRIDQLPEQEFEPAPQPVQPKKRQPSARDLMREIDSDVDKPVVAAAKPVRVEPDEDYILTREQRPVQEVKPATQEPAPAPKAATVPETIPAAMPDFEMEEPIPPAPVLEKPKAPAAAVPGKVTSKDARESAAEVAEEIAKAQTVAKPEYNFPPIELLNAPMRGAQDGTLEMRENSRRLNETLASFKIEAHIINVTRGPSVTRYEVELDKGVRLNKLTTCADDIALSLGASGVRIAAVPGKISVVGIEVPNRAVTTVSLREVIDSYEFSRSKSKASFAVGKDIGGNCIVGNIAKLPHMLIAGTTGSGKSVCMNSLIISLLYKASPEDVKLIMVDPKMVELGIYNGIPHLLIPVVTDPKKAAGALQWAVTEMMRRYETMRDAGVRDLESFNSMVETGEIETAKLPRVVVIIDELADLMLVAAKEVEESICRIAQMGRAAGVHLVIATQRPSADVITGLMKANIPSRIAFAVASAMESRIILDTQGAEKLVGKGDMLFAPIGAGKPMRVQGCFVSDGEVEAVASHVKKNFTTDYDQKVMEEIERKAVQTGNKSAASDPEPNSAEMDGDEMLPAAVDVILETGQASVSMLQRRLKLGYARAARIVDEMEEKGIVGPFQGSKPRAILVTKEQWEFMKSGEPSQMDFDDLEGVPEEID